MRGAEERSDREIQRLGKCGKCGKGGGKVKVSAHQGLVDFPGATREEG